MMQPLKVGAAMLTCPARCDLVRLEQSICHLVSPTPGEAAPLVDVAAAPKLGALLGALPVTVRTRAPQELVRI